MEETILTVTGRPMQVPAGCRLPVKDYRALARMAVERRTTLSSLLREAAQAMLLQHRLEVRDVRNER